MDAGIAIQRAVAEKAARAAADLETKQLADAKQYVLLYRRLSAPRGLLTLGPIDWPST